MKDKTFLFNDRFKRVTFIKYVSLFKVYDYEFVVFREVRYDDKKQRYVRKNKSFLSAHLETGTLIKSLPQKTKELAELEAIKKLNEYSKERIDSNIAEVKQNVYLLLQKIID